MSKEWKARMNFLTISDEHVHRLHGAAKNLLETAGFRVAHEGLLRMARAAGAAVDEQSGIVRLPGALVDELLAQVPREYTAVWADGNSTRIGGDSQHCQAIVTDPWIVDYATQRPRRPCLGDVQRHTTIAQKLERVVAASRMDFPVTDFDDATSSLRALEQFCLHFGKHYCAYTANIESFRQYVDIGRILTQGREVDGSLMTTAVAVVSPLTLNDLNAELLLGACENNFVVTPTICPMAGSTAPYSRAGMLVEGHAENLAVAALTQIVKPGNPYLYTFGPSVTDLRSGHDLYYTLDKALLKVAAVQLARSLGIPCGAECGGTMTYRYDPQNGAEGSLFMLAAQASKAHLLCGIGSCHNANGMSAEMMLIQTEWLRSAEYLGRELAIDERLLALDNIRQAGPGGHFLTDELTLELMHAEEFFAPEVLDYGGGYDNRPSLLERAHAKVEELTAEMVSPLAGQVQEELRRYFHDAYARMT